MRRQLPGFLSHFLRSCHPHRNIDTCSSKDFQPTLIQSEELSITFKDANGWDLMWVEVSIPELLCQIINRSPIPKSGFNACLAEADTLGIQQRHALPTFLRQ
jgi:hypothetical protein